MKRVIWVRPELKRLEKVDTVIHECLHVEFPDLTEEAVDATATKIAKLLRKLGLVVLLLSLLMPTVRKLHLVRPDLLSVPISYEVYC